MQQFNDNNENASFGWQFSVLNKKNIKLYVIIAAVLIVYALEIEFVGFSIPCIFYVITGYKCPGCGISHLLMAILHLDFAKAFVSNPFIFVTSPVILYFFFKNMLYNCGFIQKKITRKGNIVLYIYIALFVIYGVVRNIIKI